MATPVSDDETRMVGLIAMTSLAGPAWMEGLVLASLAGPGLPVTLGPKGPVALVYFRRGAER